MRPWECRLWPEQQSDFGATSVLLSIREVAKTLRAVPGRKTLILFSSGFPLTPDREAELTATVDALNKSNIAVYPVDVRGLAAIPSPGMDYQSSRAPRFRRGRNCAVLNLLSLICRVCGQPWRRLPRLNPNTGAEAGAGVEAVREAEGVEAPEVAVADPEARRGRPVADERWHRRRNHQFQPEASTGRGATEAQREGDAQ